MRTCSILIVAVVALGAPPAAPEDIVFGRVFPSPGQLGLFVAASDGSNERPLLASADLDYDPVWSPDGSSIVFTSERDGSADLFRVHPDGSGLERLTDHPAYDDQAAFSPDGKQLVFVSTRGAGIAHLWTMDLKTRRAKMLTSGAGGDFRPSWSPDGSLIAFSSDRGSTLPFAHGRWERLQLADVIYHDDRRNVLAPQWSPRGDKILFGVGVFNAFFNGFHGLFLKPEDRSEGGAQIAIINPDGSDFHEVTTGPNNNGFPSMAPDGQRFVYRTFGPEGSGLRIMNLATKAVTTLTRGYDNFPLWSPRGDLVMFSRQADGDYEIYTIKPDGTSLKRLTFARGNDAHMAWSPEGERIAFASERMGFKDEAMYTDAPQPYGELFVMRYDGTGIQQLTDNQWEDGTPAGQPSRRLASRP